MTKKESQKVQIQQHRPVALTKQNKIPPATLDSFNNLWDNFDLQDTETLSFVSKGTTNNRKVQEFPELSMTVFCSKTMDVFAEPNQHFRFLILGFKNLIETRVCLGIPGTSSSDFASEDCLYKSKEDLSTMPIRKPYTPRGGVQIEGCNLTRHIRPCNVFAVLPIIRKDVMPNISLLAFYMNKASEVGEKMLKIIKRLRFENKSSLSILFSLKIVKYDSQVVKNTSYMDFGNLNTYDNSDGEYLPTKPASQIKAELDDIFSKVVYEKGNLGDIISTHRLEG